MRIVFCVLLLSSVCHKDVNPTKNNLKPSFYPYCRNREKCIPACNCEVLTGCLLLNMDDSIRSSIVYYHNQIREIQTQSELKPSAMTLLEYDKELEEISMCWAARCEDVYSDCFVSSRFPDTSQSVIQVALGEDQQPNVFLWMQVMNEWLGRLRDLPAEVIREAPGGEKEANTHNFIQIISDRVLAIGCAWSALSNILTLVCTYGPRGSKAGEPVYNTGFPCSVCPGGYACDHVQPFEHLCKLKIYSVDSTQQSPRMMYESPPPIPPEPPFLQEMHEDSDIFLSTALLPEHMREYLPAPPAHRFIHPLFRPPIPPPPQNRRELDIGTRTIMAPQYSTSFYNEVPRALPTFAEPPTTIPTQANTTSTSLTTTVSSTTDSTTRKEVKKGDTDSSAHTLKLHKLENEIYVALIIFIQFIRN